ncbi:ATXR2 [Symbiodinium natans]|uniref:ATXR2 protein n=1 Tax=Symbiodinium natans TaxID=878477 RepID=A0A812IAD5_9DINO|nr:ATXR2 [Symbiodinium natans]
MAVSPREKMLAGAGVLGSGPDPNWIDNFTACIFKQDYDSAREVLRAAIARGVSTHLAEQYAKVLEDFLAKRDEVENPVVLARFEECVVRQTCNGQGRGLYVPRYQTWGAHLWKERPLAYIQSPGSRKCAQVCVACMLPVGSLASQLRYMNLEPPPGSEEIHLSTYPDELCPDGFCPGQIIACTGCTEGCAEVFCSESCRAWALSESSHAVLCKSQLGPNSWAALQDLEHLAFETDSEHLLLLAHQIACMMLARKSGQSLDSVKHRFVSQFASAPWDSLTTADGGSDTPEERRRCLSRAIPLIETIFEAEDMAADFLDADLLSGILGTYELVNMCISLPHPLNSHTDVAHCMTDQLADAVTRLQEPLQSDTESETSETAETADTAERTDRAVLASAQSGQLFENIIGTALCEALAFTNHSCLPNCRIEFATASQPEAKGPGLWVYCVTRRPLVPGDEVLMAYVPSVVGKPLQVRQRKMEKFGFTCHCRTCETDRVLEADMADPSHPLPSPISEARGSE